MKVYRILKHRTAEVRHPSAPLITASLDEFEEIIGGIEDHDIGDVFSLRVVEMSPDDYAKLEEWGGW